MSNMFKLLHQGTWCPDRLQMHHADTTLAFLTIVISYFSDFALLHTKNVDVTITTVNDSRSKGVIWRLRNTDLT